MISRRKFIATTTALGCIAIRPAMAHHGWRWTADGNFELKGVIRSARLGMPHGVLEVSVDGDVWTVEAGQPWRHERAGLNEALLKQGTEITVSGGRSSDPADKRVKAERITIAGKMFNLYPDRN